MIPYLLLPRMFKWVGLVLALVGYWRGFNYAFDANDVTRPEGLLIQVCILVGLLMIAGARERTEDEMIKQIRLTSLQWSVFIFIGLRLFYKSVAFITKDENWLPHWQVNSLLLFYLGLFYYQVYIKEYLAKILRRGGNEE